MRRHRVPDGLRGRFSAAIVSKNGGETPAPQTSPAQAADPYEEKLEEYRAGLCGGWGPEAFEAAGLCCLCGIPEAADGLGYRTEDLDGDGAEELIVGNGKVIYDLYTMENGAPVRVFSGAERNSYSLCADRTIVNQGTNGAASSIVGYYALEGASLQPVLILVFDTDTWYRSETSLDPEEGAPISDEEAETLMAAREAVDLNLKSL